MEHYGSFHSWVQSYVAMFVLVHRACSKHFETTVKGIGLAKSAGKEDPVELDSSLILWENYTSTLKSSCIQYHGMNT